MILPSAGRSPERRHRRRRGRAEPAGASPRGRRAADLVAAIDGRAAPAGCARRSGASFDDCAEALIGTDLTGVVAHWNGEAERRYGWSAAKAIGRPIEQLVVARRDEQLSRRIMRSICWTGHWEGDFWVRRAAAPSPAPAG